MLLHSVQDMKILFCRRAKLSEVKDLLKLENLLKVKDFWSL